MKIFTVSTVIIIFFSSTQIPATKLPNNVRKTAVKSSDSGPFPAIIEGEVADIRNFPYAVRLYVSYYSEKYSTCTAQAIHEKLVITAAHCLQEPHKDILVVAGHGDHREYDPTLQNHLYFYTVVEVFSHPQYLRHAQYHDVAILKTKIPMNHPGHSVVPVSYQNIEGQIPVTIYGWGLTNRYEPNNVLHTKQLKAEVCSLDPKAKYNHLCLLEKGIALGDSGGGMVYNGSLIGVASFYEGPIWTDFFNPYKVNRAYYYTAMHQEHNFVKECISKNKSQRNSTEDLTVSIILLIIIINWRDI